MSMIEERLNYLVAGAFVGLIFVAIITVTAIIPAWTFQPEPTEVAYKYEPDSPQQRGRDIYRREGCFYCHTQFTRYQDREGGEMVKAGDYVYETPHVLGTERTGPDLSNIGGKYPDAWHKAHHRNPRAVKPGSIMPSYSYLSDHEMDDLVAYLQSVGSKRIQPHWITPPQEFRDKFEFISEKVNVNNSAVANSGRGIYMQNCASCHGIGGQGNGPVSASMVKKPANLTRPFYKKYSDAMWYWRVSEGVPGTRMPKWDRTLGDENIMYLVAYLKTLPTTQDKFAGDITEQSQVDDYHKLESNYWEIEALNSDSRYTYGGGRE